MLENGADFLLGPKMLERCSGHSCVGRPLSTGGAWLRISRAFVAELVRKLQCGAGQVNAPGRTVEIDYQSPGRLSPPAIVEHASNILGEIESLIHRTEPSAIAT